MVYGKMKQKILSLLDLKTETGVQNGSVYDAVISSMASAVDGAGRKTAAALKNLIKCATVTLTEEGSFVTAAVPTGFISLKAVVIGGENYAPARFFVSSGNICAAGVPAGEAELIYYSYPASVENLSDAAATDYDGIFFDTVAVGAAAELSPEAYPGDVSRYSALAAEYDSKLAVAFISGEGGGIVDNALYGDRRFS